MLVCSFIIHLFFWLPEMVNKDKYITESDVLRTRLKCRTSSGPDGLPPVLFKRLKYCLSFSFAMVFNQLISVGEVPHVWKNAFIVPVYKKKHSW